LIVGIIYERRHTREITDYGGLWNVMPIYGAITLIVVLSSAGLPGLNGFVGEFVIMQGAFIAPELGWGYLAFAVIGVILAAVYLLRMFRGAFMGPVARSENEGLPDLNQRELVTLVLLLIPIIGIGLYPGILFGPMQESLGHVVQEFATSIAGQ
ncbi:MAG: NADH-quinone oxidoreductase subunit M, partial [Chloroflexaceae bacterium]|nr:NADH-quinone oxidoreductase subunit M [Chloroflexaceae bacterium]